MRRWAPPPQPQSLRGFIVVVVIVIIVTAVTTAPPPLSCDLFVCCVFVCHCVLSPSSSGDGLPAHRISHRHCRRFHCRRHRPRHRLLHLRCHLTPPLCNLFGCCLRVLVSCFKLFVTTVPEHFSRTKLLAGVTLSSIMVTSLHATPCVPYGDFIIIGD